MLLNKEDYQKSPIGSKNIELERSIRAHSNFCETVPINLFLSLILYFNNLLFFVVQRMSTYYAVV